MYRYGGSAPSAFCHRSLVKMALPLAVLQSDLLQSVAQVDYGRGVSEERAPRNSAATPQ